MKRWYKLYDTAKLPIRILYFAILLLSFGYIIQNDNVNIFYTFNNNFLILVSEVALKTGETLLKLLPLFFLSEYVAKRANSGAPIAMALVGYVSYLIVMMVFTVGTYPNEAYATMIDLSFDASSFPISSTGVRYPLNTGLFGILAVGFITRFAYIKSRNRSSYSLLNFVSKNTAGFIYVVVGCSLLGFISAYLYPFVYLFFNEVIKTIGKSINDPLNLAIYGALDIIMMIMGMPDLIRSPFWFSALGGSYQTLSGQTILGDVNIWNYLRNAKGVTNTFVGCGRFITPYYILNIFVIPAIYLALFVSITDKKDRARKVPLFLVLTISSILCGNPLPLEYFLLFTAPLLLFIYILMTMGIFALTTKLSLFLGFSYSGSSTMYALPGSFPDYIINLRDPMLYDTVIGIALLGLGLAIFAFIIAYIYYHYLSYDLLQSGKKKQFLNSLYQAVGGFDNIITSTGSLLRINLVLKDLEAVDYSHIALLGTRRTVETKEGITLDIGSAAIYISKEINKQIKEKLRA